MVLEEVRRLKAEATVISFCHERREMNVDAHNIAKNSLGFVQADMFGCWGL